MQQLIRAASNIGEANIQSRLPLPGNKDEIHQLATTINDLLQRLEGSVQREKQFTADASHEIRTPLTAIRGMLEVLTRKKREPEQYEQKIKLVINEVDRLHALIDQLLQLARLESARVPVNMAPVELHEFMEDLASKWTPRLYQKKMTLRLQIPVQVIVTTDTSLLRFILDNIMENAYKYGNSGGHIECSWHMQDKSLTISDNGPGIPEIHLSHIFDRFYRTDSSRSSEVQGVGLGLSIAKKMADLLHIRLTANSREGEGTAFILFFR
ncbi:MAG: HAMP domain-containing histidine kinase [Saprospiraceae bacterium]|nr:HAMP domain-containing histidine kinase [Saprospiraceae bacterium]